MNRDVQDLQPNKPEEDNTDLIPNSCACSDLDLDNALLLMQVMLNCIVCCH